MTLLNKICDKSVTVTVMGLGYVGLPLMANLIKKGFSVKGFDPDTSKINSLKAGKTYIGGVSSEEISNWKNHYVTDKLNLKELSKSQVFIVCVPTPLDKYHDPDLSYVKNAAEQIGLIVKEQHKQGQFKEILAVLESTTYPGTTTELFGPTISNISGVHENIHIAFAPEREDPNNKNYKSADIPRVVGADTSYALDCAYSLYKQLVPLVHKVSNTKTAEATKIMENCFRLANISFVNELKIVFDKMGIDIWEVIEAAKTKPFGFMPFYPSAGVGGHCIAVDPFYLTWKAREFETPTRFIDLAGEINNQMPTYVVNQTAKALNSESKPIKNSSILILGAAYKPNINDLRESPALKVIELLKKEGANISYYDPHCPTLKLDGQDYKSKTKLTPRLLKSMDCVLIITNHTCFDYDLIGEHSKLIVDTRNCFNSKSIKAKVFKA